MLHGITWVKYTNLKFVIKCNKCHFIKCNKMSKFMQEEHNFLACCQLSVQIVTQRVFIDIARIFVNDRWEQFWKIKSFSFSEAFFIKKKKGSLFF